MKMKKYIFNFFSVLSVAVLFLSSCYPMDENYAWLVEKGPIVYLNKPDTVVAFGGRERIRVKWYKQGDNRATIAKLFWNGNRDSVTVDLSNHATECALESLPEGVYLIDLYFYSADGLKSTSTSIVGRTYGAVYESFLLNRTASLSDITEDETAYVKLTFPSFTSEGYIGSEVLYTDHTGAEKKLSITSVESVEVKIPKSQIANSASGMTFKVRSLYVPEPEGFSDIFYSQWEELVHPI